MKKIYYLSTCSTCKKILKELNAPSSFIMQDIKTNSITEKQLDEMRELSGSYEALFSKKARLYNERELKNQKLGEDQYKNLILEQYTFLKRPVLINHDKIFIGNAKNIVQAAKESVNE